MLYPRNSEKALDKALFADPTSEYRGAPFWAWNCRLEKDELLRQLDVLKEMGMGGAHMHVRTGMATEYLSDEFMDLISACVEKCRSEHMLAWLYDEDRWPSGAAGGLVTKDVRYRARHLLFTRTPYGAARLDKENTDSSANVVRSEKGYLLACYDVQLDETGCLRSAMRIPEDASASGRKWYAYVETDLPNPWYNNQTYANTLDKATIRRFIEITYERYLEKVGKDFSGVIPAIFTDEPQFSRKSTLDFAEDGSDVILPWSDDIPETFREAYGEDIVEKLPELFWELPDERRSVIRYHYHDHISERFTEAFSDQCGQWCEEHGLMLTGHMMEEPSLESQTAALGEAMRSYRGFQLPGIDMLCGRFELTTAKQAQSAARQYGRPGLMSELYGVTGWPCDFRSYKLMGDWQAALGVVLRVPHLAWVSMKGEAKRDYPASISYQSPWWKEYSYVEDHFARLNTALTRGEPIVRVAMIHPVESYWLHWGPAEQTHGARSQLDERFESLTKWLLEGNIDFDFISESLLPELCDTGSAPLTVGKMKYDTVIIPGCETLRSTTLERLSSFSEAGGKLVLMGSAPSLIDAIPDPRGAELAEKALRIEFSRESVLNALSEVRFADVRDENGVRTEDLLHQLRRDGDTLWLFLAHCKDPVNPDIPVHKMLTITLNGEFDAELYDTINGTVQPADLTRKNGKTLIRWHCYDTDSLLLHLLPVKGIEPVLSEDPLAAIDALRPVRIPERVCYHLEEPNAMLLDKAEYALDDGEWHAKEELLRADNVLRSQLGLPKRGAAVEQPWTIGKEDITHRVRLRFTIESAVDIEHPLLATEDAEIAGICLNGEHVPSVVTGWYTDKSIGTIALPPIRTGSNTLEITLPFGRSTNVEWCYLLGDFGVEIAGEWRGLTGLPEKLGFGDVVPQRLPHYTGNIEYIIPFETNGGKCLLNVPHFRGAAVSVSVDGEKKGIIAYPPYVLDVGRPAAGTHELRVTLLGNRENGFGPLHRADTTNHWIGPDAWRTIGAAWTESYRLTPMGLTSAPGLYTE